MRKADIYVFGQLAGVLTENDDGKFSLLYDEQYLNGHRREELEA